MAVRWFLPRLPMLRSVLPKVDVRITTYEARHPRPENNDVDAIFLYGRGNWPNMECIRLFPERLTPVCSPQIAKSLSVPGDLKGLHLLQCNPITAWSRWLEAAGVSWTPSYGETFDTLEYALSAATRGQGVALGDLSLLHDALHDGALVAPFDCVVDLGTAYYLIYSPEKGSLPKIRALREWVTSEAESPP
jgi:DNA-binding transcriptional LysR family regulator